MHTSVPNFRGFLSLPSRVPGPRGTLGPVGKLPPPSLWHPFASQNCSTAFRKPLWSNISCFLPFSRGHLYSLGRYNCEYASLSVRLPAIMIFSWSNKLWDSKLHTAISSDPCLLCHDMQCLHRGLSLHTNMNTVIVCFSGLWKATPGFACLLE